ncbi:MAG: hypothetical protein LBS96_02620 [Oscillospiraceae bacterium]|jgi:hypothetical protein|nr:hypothetical protein [Oscillospiraceae bacterium]
MEPARITIFAGHYGSGKTTLAVNYALALAQQRSPVALCDLDIVNPYFRTSDFAALLANGGVELIASPYANSNVEMPWIPTEALRILDDDRLTSVIDLGGDDSGALALGRFAPRLQGRGDVALWLVVNLCRPLTRDPETLRAVRREIEAAAHLPFTGIIGNTNLGAETTAETIQNSLPALRELARESGLPLVLTAARRDLAPRLQLSAADGECFPVECYKKEAWKI